MVIRRLTCKECDSDFKVRVTDLSKKFTRCPVCGEKVSLQPKQKSGLPPKVRQSKKTRKKTIKSSTSSVGIWIGIGGSALAVIALLITVVVLVGRNDSKPDSGTSKKIAQNQIPTEQVNTQNDSKANKEKTIPEENKAQKQTYGGKLIIPVGSPPNAFAGSFTDSSAPPKYLYHWAENKKLGYKANMKLTFLDKEETSSANCSFTVKEKSQLSSFSGIDFGEEPRTATGTAFVVDPRGYLVTCAHVIEGAEDIHVTLNNKRMKCMVVAVHESEDLAILQVHKKDLPVVPLGNSEAVELAENVRVIGYPVSSILGDTLKVTTGTVSGIHKNSSKICSRLQVDASINPGNSGGPIFDRHGNVIGIAVSKIASKTITDVAFGVPVKLAIELLKKNNVGYVVGQTDTQSTGPEIVKSSRPAIALVEVTIGKTKSQNVRIDYTMSTSTSFVPHKLPNSSMLAMPRIPRHSYLTGKLLVSEFGELHDIRSNGGTPSVILLSPSLFLDRLPRNQVDSWDHEDLQMNMGELFRVSISYKIVNRTQNIIQLQKSYHMQTVGDNDKIPRIALDYEAQIDFDTQLGNPISCQAKGKAKFRSKQGISVTAPLEFSYHIKTNDELLVEKTMLEKAMEKAKQNLIERAKPLTSTKRKNIIANIRTKDEQLVRDALRVLGDKKPTSPDDEMALVIASLLNHKSSSIRSQASLILVNWATPKVIPQITRAIRKGNTSVVNNCINALGNLKTEEAIAPIIAIISESQYRYTARNALISMGKIAEKPVLKLLKEGSSETRKEACQVLEKIGTSLSLPTLRKLITDDLNTLVKHYARNAIKAIESR